MTISKCDQLEIGHRYFKVGGFVYSVGDVIKGMKFYVSEKEYFEGDGKLTSTNVRKQTASFKGIGPLVIKVENKK